MHSKCLKAYEKTNVACPFCRKSIVDPKMFEAYMDEMVEKQPMPKEYAELDTNILCNDCNQKATVKLNFIGMKCPNCKSYNTSQISKQ